MLVLHCRIRVDAFDSRYSLFPVCVLMSIEIRTPAAFGCGNIFQSIAH